MNLKHWGELLKQRGIISKQEIIEKAKGHKEQAQAQDKSTMDMKPLTETESAVIEKNHRNYPSIWSFRPASPIPPQEPITLVEWGEKAAPKIAH